MVVASAALSTSPRARAESTEVEPDALVELDVRTEPRVSTIVTDGNHREIGRCVGRCVVRVPRGEYELHVDGEEVSSKRFHLDAQGRTLVFVDPGDARTRWTGAALAITGGAAILIGLGGAVVTGLGCMGDSCHDYGEPNYSGPDPSKEGRPYLIVAGVGAVATLTGLILYAAGATGVEVRPAAAAPPVRLSFGIAPTRGGAFGALGLTF